MLEAQQFARLLSLAQALGMSDFVGTMTAGAGVNQNLFFFKQKTAYEMIWCWSSDVCSSDLRAPRPRPPCNGSSRSEWLVQRLQTSARTRSVECGPCHRSRFRSRASRTLPQKSHASGFLERYADHRE